MRAVCEFFVLRGEAERPSIAAWLVIHGEQIIKEPQFADYSGSILSGLELGGVSKIRMIFRCGTEITTILSLS